MKSERAKEYLERHTIRTEEHGDVILKMSVERAIVDAEQDVEKKAIKAFRSFVEDYCYEAGHWDVYEGAEHHIAQFTKELQ